MYCYAECHYTECRYAECRGALPTYVLTGTNFPACISGPNTLAYLSGESVMMEKVLEL